MKCILMNKNTEILTAEYDTELKVFSEIYEVHHIDYAPVILEKSFHEGKTSDMTYLNGLKAGVFLHGGTT